MEKNREMKVKNLIAYGVGDIFGGGSFLIINMLFLFFLTEVVGMELFYAGLVILVGKGWDAISDPLMGYISDNTRSKFGRRRLYFLLGLLPIAVSFTLLFAPIRFENSMFNFLYFIFAYILFSTVFTMVMIPYSALNAEMSHDYKVRTKLTGMRINFSLISALIAATVPSLIINSYPKEEGLTAHFVMAMAFGIFYALPWIIVFFGTWELDIPEKKNIKSIKTIFKEFINLLQNKSFRVHILMYIFAYTSMDFLMMLFKYYLTWGIGKPNAFPLTMGPLMVAQIAMLAFYVYIANKKGKGYAFRIGLSIWCLGMFLSYFLDSTTPLPLVILVCVIIGMGLSAGVMIPWAILPSVVDVGEIITTEQQTGLYSGGMTFIRKLANGLAAPLVTLLLGASGYVQQATSQNPETISQIKTFFFIVPAVFIIIAIICSLYFKITPETHQVLHDELERLKAGGSKSDATTETKEVLETITGLPYEKLYTKQG